MAALTESIVGFVCTDQMSPPARVLSLAAAAFRDTISVQIAGAREPVVRNLARAVLRNGGVSESRLLYSDQHVPAQGATLVGTGAAHALDYDDYAFSNHTSALLVPAILAEAEIVRASGREMLEAYAVGHECWGAIMKREPDHLHSKGWHPTGTFGPLGVCLAVSRLNRLDPDTVRNALGLAVTHAGGVMANFGTQAKPYQGARAAEAGVKAVRLAQAGLDAGDDALDGDGGLLYAMSPRLKVDLESSADNLGSHWDLVEHGLNVKLHPMVGASQRAIDCAIQIRRDHFADGLQVDDIARIVPHVSQKHIAVMRFPMPNDAHEAKFSLSFGVAAGLLFGRVGLSELSDETVRHADVRRLMELTEPAIGPDDDPVYPVGAKFDEVEVHLKDGTRVVSDPVRRFRGHGDNPASSEELQDKFLDCAGRHLSSGAAEELFEILADFESLSGVDDLPRLELLDSR